MEEVNIFFFYSANFFIFLILVVFSFLVFVLLKTQNPIHALLIMLIIFIGTSLFLFILDLDYLAFIFLIVYSGAITILFLMVIMMLNRRIIEIKVMEDKFFPFVFFFLLGLFLIFFVIFLHELFNYNNFNIGLFINFGNSFDAFQYLDYLDFYNSVSNDLITVAHLLYETYGFSLIFLSIILFLAIMGPILLTQEINENRLKLQFVFIQNFRKAKLKKYKTLYFYRNLKLKK